MQADVGILTVLPDCELRAVLSAFDVATAGAPDRNDLGVRYWEAARVRRRAGRDLRVVVTSIADPGNASASAATTALLKEYQPELVCLVGIAAGHPERTRLGDVIVVKQVLGYEGERLEEHGGDPRPTWRHPPSAVDLDASHFVGAISNDELSSRIRRAASQLSSDELPPAALMPESPAVRRGHIASGEKLFADGSLANLPRRFGDSRIIAGEMEGIGFAVSAYREDTPWLIIRGVSDHGDPRTKDGRYKDRFHNFASIAAAQTLRMFLETAYTPRTLRYRSSRVASAIAGAPPIVVRTALLTLADKSGIELVVQHFVDTGVRMIATPATAGALGSLGIKGCHATTTFEFTRTKPIQGRRGTLHPYILDALAASAQDQKHLRTLRSMGVSKIDLIIVNTRDPELGREGGQSSQPADTLEALMEKLSQVQIGGPSLLRWALKQWRTCAAVVDPLDYAPIVADLSEHANTLSQSMRARLLTRALQLLAQKDQETARFLNALWPRASLWEEANR